MAAKTESETLQRQLVEAKSLSERTDDLLQEGDHQIGDLARGLADARQVVEVLEDLAPGDLAQPIESNQGIHLVMICERTEPESPLATREEVRANLENAQFDLIARGYLRDLRRQAFVDVRI